jgi:hypothetical protein
VGVYEISKRPETYRGPTWSWVSCNSKIEWARAEKDEIVAEVVEGSCKVPGKNYYLSLGFFKTWF